MVDDDPFSSYKFKDVPLATQLENASVGDLEKRIAALKAEISACEAAIAKKKAHMAAADSIFGGKSS